MKGFGFGFGLERDGIDSGQFGGRRGVACLFGAEFFLEPIVEDAGHAEGDCTYDENGKEIAEKGVALVEDEPRNGGADVIHEQRGQDAENQAREDEKPKSDGDDAREEKNDTADDAVDDER